MPTGESLSTGVTPSPTSPSVSKKKESRKKKKSSSNIYSTDNFPILPRADDDDYFDAYATADFIENGVIADTHGRPKSTVIKGPGLGSCGIGIAEPEKGGVRKENIWVERRGRDFCGCCGGCKAAIRRKPQIVGVCGCCVFFILVSAVLLLL